MPDSEPLRPRCFRFSLRSLLVVVLVFGGCCGAIRMWWRHQFPYGARHRCILQFSIAFQQYAVANGGWLPAGEVCPEASLSLLYRNGFPYADTLAGKSVDRSVAQQTLDATGRLSPASCGWEYVEGFTTSDDGGLAVLWDKVPGLGHNGNRLADGAREVLFLRGDRRFVSAAEWTKFLKEQERLRLRRTPPAAGSSSATP